MVRSIQLRILVFVLIFALAIITGDSFGTPEEVPVAKSYQNAFEISYRMTSIAKYDEAIRPLKELLDQNPSDYTVNLRLGYLNHLKGDLDASIHFYKRAVRLRPKALEPRLGLITQLLAKMDYQEVVAVGLSALKLDPKNYTFLSKVAYSYYLLGKNKKAATYYEKILELYPTDLAMRNGLGWSYLEAGEKEKAKKAFIQILLLSPYNQSALFGHHKCK
jgi:tetratricopeptide (TPR) repeat protein